MRFVFTCGGTAGHINPALGVAGRLRELLPDAEFLFIGARGMMETELVPREGYEIKTVEISNLSRSLSLSGLKHNLHTARTLLTSVPEAKNILREFRPDAAIGTGGYVCYPVLKAAHALGVPTLVHESNAVPGLTTRLLAKTVDCVMVGFAGAAENYPRGTNVAVTGTPVRGAFETADRASARRTLGLADDTPLLLSVWGSLGSDYINGILPEVLEQVAAQGKFHIIHSAGKRGYAKLLAAAETRCGGDWREKGIDLREYIYDMPAVMAAADLVVCRSGASTLSELAALGKPAILIPSPNVTNNHQEKNARLLEKCGAAKVLLEGELTPERLCREAAALLEDPAALQRMGDAMRGAAVPDATGKIAGLILDFIK